MGIGCTIRRLVVTEDGQELREGPERSTDDLGTPRDRVVHVASQLTGVALEVQGVGCGQEVPRVRVDVSIS